MTDFENNLETMVQAMIGVDEWFEDYNGIQVSINSNGQFEHIWVHKSEGNNLYRLAYEMVGLKGNVELNKYMWKSNEGWTKIDQYNLPTFTSFNTKCLEK